MQLVGEANLPHILILKDVIKNVRFGNLRFFFFFCFGRENLGDVSSKGRKSVCKFSQKVDLKFDIISRIIIIVVNGLNPGVIS